MSPKKLHKKAYSKSETTIPNQKSNNSLNKNVKKASFFREIIFNVLIKINIPDSIKFFFGLLMVK